MSGKKNKEETKKKQTIAIIINAHDTHDRFHFSPLCIKQIKRKKIDEYYTTA